MIQHDGDGFEENLDFEPKRAIFYVLDIVEDFFLGAEVITAADLSETGDAGLYLEALSEAVDVFLEGIIEYFAFGARTDE